MDIVPTRDQVPRISREQRVLAPRTGVAAPMPTGGGGGGISGQDIIRIILKRWVMILVTALIVMGIGILGTMLWFMFAPSYTATAILAVNPPKRSEFASAVLPNKDVMERLLWSHARLIRSDPVLIEAIKDERIAGTAWFRENRDDAVLRLMEDIEVAPQPGTNHIRISMTYVARNEKEQIDLAEIVNAVASQFVKNSRDSVSEDFREDIERLLASRRSLVNEIDTIRRKATATRRSARIPILENKRNIVEIQMQSLTTQLIQLKMAKAQSSAALTALDQQVADDTIMSAPEVTRAMEMDPILRGLQNAELNLVTQRPVIMDKYGAKHRSAQSFEIRLDSIREQIAEKEKMVIGRAVGFLRATRDAEDVAITSQLVEIQEQFDEASRTIRELEQTLIELKQLGIEEKNKTQMIDKIDKHLVDVQMLASGEQQVMLRVPATQPKEVSLPKWKVFIPLSIVLGLVISFGLAFAIEFIDTSIKTPSDVIRRVDLPLLGMIPHSDDLEEDIADLRLAFMTNPNSMFGEAFRQVRTCLLFSGPASQRRSMLVTSPLPEDGRSTVAINLAAAIAQDGRKVLIVDANFRQPIIRTLFPDCPQGGLSNALVGQKDWKDLLYEVQPNLHVLPAGILPPNPAELLGSDEMRRIIAEMDEQYDQVVFDGAPCLVVTDSPILATVVDGVIIAVRAGANTYGIVQRTRDVLHRVGAHITGVALNGVRATAGGYLRKNYETFYEYHEQPSLPETSPPEE